MKEKNSFIEILRFLFALMIFFHHSGFFAPEGGFLFEHGGLYAVEFFFMLTGALTMRHIMKHKELEERLIKENNIMAYGMNYTISKLKKVFPYAFLGIMLSYVWYFLWADASIGLKDRLFGRWNIVFEALFIPMTGIMDVGLLSYLNTPLWYLSSILICLPLIFYLIVRFKDLFLNYLCPVLGLMIHGYLINTYGAIGGWGVYKGFFYSGVLRAFADLLLGVFVFVMAKRLEEKRINIPGILWTLLEIGLYAFSIYTFSSNVDGYTYEAAVLFMAMALIISLSNRSFTSQIRGRVFDYLGALSLPIYCLHWPVDRLCSLYLEGKPYALATGVSFLIVLLLSMGIMAILNLKKNDLGKSDD